MGFEGIYISQLHPKLLFLEIFYSGGAKLFLSKQRIVRQNESLTFTANNVSQHLGWA
jgi:hypothetical protein